MTFPGQRIKATRPLAAGLLWLVLLFVPASHAALLRIVAIGDYGTDNSDEAAVARLIKTNLLPAHIVTLGDNAYGDADDLDRCIGKYYQEFIGNYRGTYGAGAVSNRFWPALGNHDYYSDNYSAYRNYFTLPNNERYYDVLLGPVHFFVTNTDDHEPDGNNSTSDQALWISNRMAQSTAPWKIVLAHHPPYSSGGSFSYTRWPYKQWGASAVIAGHAHHYERLVVNDLLYLVNGLGGAGVHGISTPVNGSIVRYNDDHGALLILADEQSITFEFHSVAGGGTLIDRVTLGQPNSAPVFPALSDVETVEEQPWRRTVTADDPDGDTIRYALEAGAPATAEIDSVTGEISWTPSEQDGPGTFTMGVRATDDGSPPQSAVASFSVTVRETNTAPVLGLVPDQDAMVGVRWTWNVQVQDRDRPTNQLVLSLVESPAGMTLDASAGRLNWTPAGTNAGLTFPVLLRVTDNGTPAQENERRWMVHAVHTNMPTLRVRRQSDPPSALYLSWPTNFAGGCQLQERDGFSASAWGDSSGTPALSNGVWTLHLVPSATSRLFRLRR